LCNQTEIPKLFVILGPTAIGKSRLAFNLANKYDASIINADSLQIYKYLDIGTSKATLEERKIVHHYMIDVLEPNEDFNAGKYRKMVVPLITKLTKNNKNIILVGGTFLYVKILLSGIIGDSEINYSLRNRIEIIKNEKGILHLYRLLLKVDKDAAEKIDQNDYIRIQRALEVYFNSGIKISELQKEHNFQRNYYEICKIGLNTERNVLNNIIDKRVKKMFEEGFREEVIKILEMGFSPDIKPMQSIGYKEINNYLSDNIDLETAISHIQQNTRRYAKRQLTWLRKEKDIIWYEYKNENELIEERFKYFFNI